MPTFFLATRLRIIFLLLHKWKLVSTSSVCPCQSCASANRRIIDHVTWVHSSTQTHQLCLLSSWDLGSQTLSSCLLTNLQWGSEVLSASVRDSQQPSSSLWWRLDPHLPTVTQPTIAWLPHEQSCSAWLQRWELEAVTAHFMLRTEASELCVSEEQI